MIVKRFVTPLALVAALVWPVSAVNAFESSSYAALTSNYVFRGQTQSNDGAALQGSYELEQFEDEGWYAGIFASTVTRGAEADLFGGWKGAFNSKSNLGYDVGIIKYNYTDHQFSPDITEFYAGVNYETAYIKLFNGSGAGVKTYNYLDVGASFIVLEDLDLQLHLGRYVDSPSSNDVSANLALKVKDFDLNLGITYENRGTKNDAEFFVIIGKKFK